jgi:hypothetical protein
LGFSNAGKRKLSSREKDVRHSQYWIEVNEASNSNERKKGERNRGEEKKKKKKKKNRDTKLERQKDKTQKALRADEDGKTDLAELWPPIQGAEN